ncbi:endoglucanase E-4-like [Branchiostoma floridae]|uniref:Endoglucanase n=1 Tax=Branchiostoma floridae TaxID=7739 RepID=A0A9J7M4Y7_BRAFL|nr:endoglucanase E-4-like [Branchiostoma floridae]
MKCSALILLALLGAARAQSYYQVIGDWGNRFQANVFIPVPQDIHGGWSMTFLFDKPVYDMEIWRAQVVNIREGNKAWDLSDLGWNSHLAAGTYDMTFVANTDGSAPGMRLFFNGVEVGSGGTATTTQRPGGGTTTSGGNPAVVIDGRYDYVEALHKSILFYEAQRAGNLPSNNRIPWRRNCCQGDGSDVGLDLSGGWFDAGDHLKLHFPLAYTITVLSWGMIEFKSAYEAAGEMGFAMDSIKWVTDYFIKCHPSKFEFVAQVGDTEPDHQFWGKPQDMTMRRPAKKVTANQPGSDVTAETAAAMAAASIVFRENGDPGYADTLLSHAKDLYEFADTYRGEYQNVVHDTPYPSFGGMNDELVWGAAWLHRATQDGSYLSKAESYYDQYGISSGGFSWDEKQSGTMLVLYKATNKDKYKNDIIGYLSRKMPGGGDTYTPKGMLWLNEWGSCRHSANHAFLALVAADMGINVDQYRGFAAQQINYMLGDAGRSMVVGFGNNPPVRPHHRAATCPVDGHCDWNTYNSWDANANVLQGALVGGPDAHDNYSDDRSNFHTNEVAVDYNAGFQGCLAALIKLGMK